MIANGWNDYEVLATSAGEKLERFGNIYLLRPDPQVIWDSGKRLLDFPKLHAAYKREATGGGHWEYMKKMPEEWTVSYKDLTFLLKPMGFKHVGLFPEQSVNWDKMRGLIARRKQPAYVLNLFAYTGGASVACAKSGAKVTHVDAAKNMVERAKQNACRSGIAADGIRYIVDDCKKFILREIKRGKRYDGILMDPPSYGRGPGGEMWKLEDDLFELVRLAAQLLSDQPLFYLINSYTTGLQPAVIGNLLSLALGHLQGRQEAYELCLPTQEGIVLPCGCSGLWQATE